MENLLKIEDWYEELENPLLIAGPCSAETEAQMLETADGIAKYTDAKVFRAGVWKPRTRPGSFEGVGEIGLLWLQKVRDRTGMLVATEVANAEHVRLAFQYNIDILWIGARTTGDPFAVQEIADAVRDSGATVLVKNPISQDLQLWIGALERIRLAGITKLGAIHRGFAASQSSKYRNDPHWKLPMELRRIYPTLPIICDPSHIAGKRQLVGPIAQQAYNLKMDGLMIETHTDPENAWSDASQQLDPHTLSTLIESLRIKGASADGEDYSADIDFSRDTIDTVDDEILDKFANRFAASDAIAAIKKKHSLAIFQPERYTELIESRKASGRKFGLDAQFVEELYVLVHKFSVRAQENASIEEKATNTAHTPKEKEEPAVVTGTLIEFGKVNSNGVMFTKEAFSKANIAALNIEAKKGTLLGGMQLANPDELNLKEVSYKVTGVKANDKTIEATITPILGLRTGEFMNEMLKSPDFYDMFEMQPVISSRGNIMACNIVPRTDK